MHTKAKATLCNIFMRLQCNLQKGNPKALKGSPKKVQKRLQMPATKSVWADFVAKNSAKKRLKRHNDIFECFCVRTFERFNTFEYFFCKIKNCRDFMWLHYKNFQATAILQLHCSRAKKTHQCSLSLRVKVDPFLEVKVLMISHFWRQFWLLKRRHCNVNVFYI